ncbi:F-box/LRR-repeat protein 6 isoform X2 [Polyodon spathula]|uniref:F-box/LRR-repeat protein 6 isoform X2 n=1 Tax=Polyodon spathula TaxID=7913 RepID=UPI001B7E208B|nr:F-box/LRR-repeat protein 6 isoform X2 [Polyodon spathula]
MEDPGEAQRVAGTSQAAPAECVEEAPSSGSTRPGAAQKRKRNSTSKDTVKRTKVKVKSESAPKGKKKKAQRKTAKWNAPRYTIQETDNDMLLLIPDVDQYEVQRRTKRRARKVTKSNTKRSTAPKTTVKSQCKAERKRDGPPSAALVGVKLEEQGSWGVRLPAEILVRIFQVVVNRDGALPFLCRVSRVCRLWHGAASSPVLWRSTTLGFCWTEPGKQQLLKTQVKIQNTVSWLAQNRFSQLREFALCHWKHLVNYTVQDCAGVTSEAFLSLASGCTQLASLNLQHSQVHIPDLISFLETYGGRIKQLHITFNSRVMALINAISVLRLLNQTWLPKVVRGAAVFQSGFPQLEELCLATSSSSSVEEQVLHRLLHGSPRLRVLDLRGCYRVTPAGLSTLPCKELECLYLGLYCSSNNLTLPKEGSHLLTGQWKCTLLELDLRGQAFSEEDLEIAMTKLTGGEGSSPLRSLNLEGTKVPLSALRLVITLCPRLTYLNLTSCRYLPRGLKRVYRGQEDIQLLYDRLLKSTQVDLDD